MNFEHFHIKNFCDKISADILNAEEIFVKRNFWLDVILFISGLICIVTGILMDFHIVPGGREVRHIVRLAHTYTGYIMAVGIIFHIVWHGNWIKSAAKNVFRKKSEERL